ncbi:MAG TPA: hypothetical protein VFC71_07795 [Candidatus Polarisedimenticolia bacterium]|nr:hypothetical protein [Candidatus Polarisedimenticolia bacterium]
MTTSFDRFAGRSSILAGLAGLGYALAFVVLKNALLGGLFLMLAPLLALAGLVAVWSRLREVDAAFAALALGLGFVGSIGAAAHGAHDLANVLHPPTTISDLPSSIDPRGFMTFGLTGLALVIFAWLATRSLDVPGWVGPLGLILGAVLVLTWLARLIVLDATSVLVLAPALIAGVLSPVFYLALGAWLLGWRR